MDKKAAPQQHRKYAHETSSWTKEAYKLKLNENKIKLPIIIGHWAPFDRALSLSLSLGDKFKRLLVTTATSNKINTENMRHKWQ